MSDSSEKYKLQKPQIYSSQKGKMDVVTMDTGGAKRQGGCAQTYLQKYSILFLGSVPGCWVTEAGGKHKEAEGEGEEQQRHEAVNRNSFSERLAG